MQTLAIGDLHLKQSFVLPAIDRLLKRRPEIGHVVFLGDACDDWGATATDEVSALRAQAIWAAARRSEGLLVDVLIGNHDLRYLDGRPGPGSVLEVSQELRSLLLTELEAKAAAVAGPYLCTHAGLTEMWAISALGDLPDEVTAQWLANELNAMFQDAGSWATLDSCGPGRGGFSLPGPLWADLRELISDPLVGIGQIVGHTPVISVSKMLSAPFGPIFACDTMSLTRNGYPIGDASVLIVSNTGATAVEALPLDFDIACREHRLAGKY